MSTERKGIVYGLAAYTSWGLFPLFWKLLDSVPADQILAQRIVWSLLFFLFLLWFKGRLSGLLPHLRDRRTLIFSLGTAALITVNWYTYIWGVNAGYIIETSLGYFINPLVSLFLGIFIFKEGLRPMQWLALILVIAGVVYLAFNVASLWISLVLAFSFGFYGLLKKMSPVPTLEGMSLETGLLFIPALLYLIFAPSSQGASYFFDDASIATFLIVSGVVTAFPLIWFSECAQRVPLSLLGLLQYIAPSLQFAIGLLIFHEPFDSTRFWGFAIIWFALALFSIEGFLFRRKPRAKGF